MNGMISAGPTLEKRISGSPKSASSAAIVMSHIITISQPPPRQWPCTEAITGLRMSHGVISRRDVVGERLVPGQRVALAARRGPGSA